MATLNSVIRDVRWPRFGRARRVADAELLRTAGADAERLVELLFTGGEDLLPDYRRMLLAGAAEAVARDNAALDEACGSDDPVAKAYAALTAYLLRLHDLAINHDIEPGTRSRSRARRHLRAFHGLARPRLELTR